ncbi:AT hook motif family protein [Trichomonas vaginalis G3]|uniref:AT hook motif family protein n=1 Tax=Trichomonas vaginalis (strain ATCC PRA-98 / G3) TaxID=412133 RepID=A2F363_TRIV3|nr:microtubule severing [Trichomonas vaginalis G3]EAY00671.1 AT hook motif family protein [Trichomonas vaginalis G3]KAI5487193.1 microtubule severing [Trichomonas vaginalis G3]|eukprot:XP_001313600.1 AT hook motif family protein [Trichomonas vaginalis G3]
MSIKDPHIEYEINTAALQLLKSTEPEIANKFEAAAFPSEQARENAEMTLDGVGSDYIINLLKKKAPLTTFPSIIYNSLKFKTENTQNYAKDAEIYIKRLKELKITARILGHTRSIRSMSTDPTGQILISGSQDTNIKAWHVPSLSLMKSFKGHDEPVLQTEISPDRRLVASIAEDSTLRLWSLETGAAIYMYYMPDAKQINEISFSPLNDLIALGSENGIMRILKITDLPKEISNQDKLFDQFLDLVQIPDVFPQTEDFIEFSNYNPMDYIKSSLEIVLEKNYKSPITAISFSHGGYLVASSLENGEIFITSVDNEHQWRFKAHEAGANGLIWFKNSPFTLLTWSQKGGEIKLWNLNDTIEPLVSYSVGGIPRRLHFAEVQVSCDETFLFAITANTSYAWCISDPRPIYTFDASKENFVSISPHPIVPTIIAFVSRASVFVCDLTQPEPLNKLEIPYDAPRNQFVAWHPSGLKLFSGDTGGGIDVFIVAKNPECHQFQEYFPTDFTASEWVPEVGQIEDTTRKPTHLSPTNVLIDGTKAVINDKYAPVELESLKAHAVIPSHVIHSRAMERSWAMGNPELKIDSYHKSRGPNLRCKTVKQKNPNSLLRSASQNLKQAIQAAVAAVNPPPPPPPEKDDSSSSDSDDEPTFHRGRGRPRGSKSRGGRGRGRPSKSTLLRDDVSYTSSSKNRDPSSEEAVSTDTE